MSPRHSHGCSFRRESETSYENSTEFLPSRNAVTQDVSIFDGFNLWECFSSSFSFFNFLRKRRRVSPRRGRATVNFPTATLGTICDVCVSESTSRFLAIAGSSRPRDLCATSVSIMSRAANYNHARLKRATNSAEKLAFVLSFDFLFLQVPRKIRNILS